MRSTAESANGHGQVPEALRSWISLWLTIHFFALAVCLAANFVSSELERRILNVLAPYVVGLHQDYGAVPLEMTRGAEIDYRHEYQVHEAGRAADRWQTLDPPQHAFSTFDDRWRSFERLTAMAASELNEDLIYLLLEHCLAGPFGNADSPADARTAAPADSDAGNSIDRKVDGVRLLRRATLSYTADRLRVAGELPVAELGDKNLFECRVVHLSGGRVKLLPVLETLRTAKSVSGSSVAPASEKSQVNSSPPPREPDKKSPTESRP